MSAITLISGDLRAIWDDGTFIAGSPALIDFLTNFDYPPEEIGITVTGPYSYPGINDELEVMAACALFGIEYQGGPDLSVPEGATDGSNTTEVEKHLGPGDHPSGSPQSDHGRKGPGSPDVFEEHSAEPLHVQRGEGDYKKLPVSKYILAADGSELPFSFAALPNATTMRLVDYSRGVNLDPEKIATLQDEIRQLAKDFDLDPADMEQNLTSIWDSAVERYAANPDLMNEDRFYELWHESFTALSTETGIPMERLVAAAAVISPGTNAESNLHYAHDLARFVAQNPTWQGEEVTKLADALDIHAKNTLEPRYTEHHIEVEEGTKKIGDLRDPPEPGSVQWEKGQSLQQWASELRTRDSVSLSDLPDDIAARAVHFQRAYLGAPNGSEISGTVGEYYAADKDITVNPHAGFGVKNFGYYTDAISVLRGTQTPDAILGDVKTRSFFNNIIDPTNLSGRGDVTVDFHTINYSFMTLGADKVTRLSGTPKLQGVSLGVRPLVADGIRNLLPYAQSTFVARGIQETLQPSRIQEILWAEWRRGMTRKPGSKEFVSWTSFNGEVSTLGRVSLKEEEMNDLPVIPVLVPGDPEIEIPEDIAAAAEVEAMVKSWLGVRKHMGPGDHPSGTPQTVHKPGGPGVRPTHSDFPANVGPPPDPGPSGGPVRYTGTGTRDDPIRTGDAQEAIAQLAAGKHVELTQPRQVSTLLFELHNYVEKAREAGSPIPDLDLCRVSIAGTNVFCAESKGIPRLQMPQFTGEAEVDSIAALTVNTKAPGSEANVSGLFTRYLEAQGYKVTHRTEFASYLRASQGQLVGQKVASIATLYANGLYDPATEPIFISNDNYVIDGHHRWGAVVGVDYIDNEGGDLPMNVIEIDLPILEALEQANSFANLAGIKPKLAKREIRLFGVPLILMKEKSGIIKAQRLSSTFGSGRGRRAQLIRRLKSRRKYGKPVRGGTGKQGRSRRRKWG